MENKIKNYIDEKVDAWKNKDGVSLAYDNPVLFELKWTGEHFKDLYNIAKEKGILQALSYDKLVTKGRHELRKSEREPIKTIDCRAI